MNEIEMIDPLDLTLHSVALATPRMSSLAFEALKDDIEINGQIEPVILYRGKIVDGRHRWLVAQDLGLEKIKCVSLSQNTKLIELESLVQSKENRRHETAAQLAIRAYRLKVSGNKYKSFAKAAMAIGANTKRVSEANKIASTYGRLDILELLFNGESFNTGTQERPFYTDSLGTILRWLEETNSIVNGSRSVAIEPRDELTADENIIIAKILQVIRKESSLVQAEISKRVYYELNISGSE